MTISSLATITDAQLARAVGGQAPTRAQTARDVAINTAGYAAPAATSEASGAILPVAGALALRPQAEARQNLIDTLANPRASNRQINQAFDRYHNGPGARLARHVSGW